MEPVYKHSWNLAKDKAIELQKKLAKLVSNKNQLEEVNTVVGVDVAYNKKENYCFAAAVLLNIRDLKVVEITTSYTRPVFPYIPGLFSFRETPAIIEVFKKLTFRPDLIICDGHGVAHPRRFGLASHIGILYDIPTIGCAKNCLVGNYDDPCEERGCQTPIIDNGEVVGTVLRTQKNVNPVYVSVGHCISLLTAVEYVLKLSPKYRIPEPIRLADQEVKKLLKEQ